MHSKALEVTSHQTAPMTLDEFVWSYLVKREPLVLAPSMLAEEQSFVVDTKEVQR
jgi:hypothetical protein